MSRFFNPRWLAAVALCFAAQAALASQLTLTTSAPPGSPLLLPAGSMSGIVIAQVFNNVGSDPVTDQMEAWQFRLTLVPDGGATGTVTFLTPATGTAPNPSNYVFGALGLGISVTNTGGQLDANDVHDTPGNGASQVPVSPGANLLSLGISVSAIASGTFGIYAVEGSANTEWTDNAASPQTQFFVNVPNGAGTVRIGEISVPEPGSLTAFCGVLLFLARRRKK